MVNPFLLRGVDGHFRQLQVVTTIYPLGDNRANERQGV